MRGVSNIKLEQKFVKNEFNFENMMGKLKNR